MTTSDNRTRPARRSRQELTGAHLARHVEGDYGSEGCLPSDRRNNTTVSRAAGELSDYLSDNHRTSWWIRLDAAGVIEHVE
jgi:hypothetical protein